MHAQTRRQREVFDFITRHIESHGYRPSYAVIARHLGLNSRAGIARIVRDLESQGLLTRRHDDGHFTIAIGANGEQAAGGVQIEWLDVPVNGEFREPWQDRPVMLPEFMLGYQTPERIRVYRVTDDALAAEDICEDDVALIELRQFVRDGDCVVAVVNKERSVLRKYYRVGPDIELRPADETGSDEIIRLPADHIEIIGVYRGLLRPVS
jgi:repressor LexA